MQHEKCKLQIPNLFIVTMSHLDWDLRPVTAAVFWDKEFCCVVFTRLGLSKV